jgi:hypothetical protein
MRVVILYIEFCELFSLGFSHENGKKRNTFVIHKCMRQINQILHPFPRWIVSLKKDQITVPCLMLVVTNYVCNDNLKRLINRSLVDIGNYNEFSWTYAAIFAIDQSVCLSVCLYVSHVFFNLPTGSIVRQLWT